MVNMATKTPLIGTAEAAEIIGVNVATVNRWAATGKLQPAAQINSYRGARLFRPSDVHAIRDLRAAKRAATRSA